MEKREKLYEGKAKILYATDDPELVIQYFKDDATAFNAAKKGSVSEKGIINNKISEKIFGMLEKAGIPTHLVRRLNDREMLIKKVEIVQAEVVVRNKATGSLCRNLGFTEGMVLEPPLVEFCYKRDDLNDPLFTEDHMVLLKVATREEIADMRRYALRINELMRAFFDALDLELIDFKLEFGRYKGRLILADEISPDTCRLWEKGTGRKLDKDRFRHDLGEIKEAYQEVLSRVSR